MLRDSFFSFLTTVVRLATGVVLFIVLAHLWGPERFGIFMFPFTIAGILVKLVDYGFLLQVVRDVGKFPAQAHAIMGRALGAKILLVAPTVTATIIISLYLPSRKQYAALLALLLCDAITNSFAQFLNIPLRALGRFDHEARIAAAANVSGFGLVVAVVAAGYGPIAAAAALAAGRMGYLAMSWIAYRSILNANPRAILESHSLRLALKEGFPFVVHATVGTLTMQVDTLMVQRYLGPGPVGLYQAGVRILLGALLVGDALNSVYLSAMARSSDQPEEVSRLGMRMTRHLLTVGTIAFACMLGAGHWAVHLLFGGRYDSLIPLLPLFGLLIFIRYGGVSYGTLLTLADRQIVRVIGVCVAMAMGIVFNVLLIPRFGLTGAVTASIASHVVLYAVYIAATRRDHDSFLVDWRSGILVLIAVSAITLTLSLGPGSTPTTRLQLGALIVFVSVLVGVTRSEWDMLSTRLARAIP